MRGIAPIAEVWRRATRWSGPRTPRQRLAVASIAILLMVLCVAPLFVDTVVSRPPEARDGVIDYAGKALPDPVNLAGRWSFVWLSPGPARGKAATMPVPGQWTGKTIAGQRLPATGRALYSLTIRHLPRGRYTVHLPVIWSGNRVLLDGEEVARRGAIGSSAADTRYDIRAHTVVFASDGGDIHLSVDMASFLHRDNGMEEAPVLGTTTQMDTWFAFKWARELVYHVSLLLIAALGIAVFLFRPQDRASLYFGLSCLFFLPVMAIIGFDNLLQLVFPNLPFAASLAIQYFCGILAISFFFLNTHELFPKESSRAAALVLFATMAMLAAVQSINFARGDTLRASLTQPYVMMLTLLTLFYVLAIIVRAAVRGREGALVLFFGMGLFVLSFIPGALVSTGWLPRDRVVGYSYGALGVLMLLYTHVVLMAERWSISVGNAEQMNDELRQLLEVNTAITSDLQLGSLLDKILGVTSKILRADRSSLFLKDKDNAELATLVAQGTEQPLRVDMGRGLAGYVFATGETLNIPDAYADERFNRAVDDATGYRTKSVLTVPITSRDGRRIGVMQALNRADGGEFTPDDAARMSAFGAQAAVAIDNARLFSEAFAARSFDDSILRSMSGGVVALDSEWKITKLNAAAAEILGASRTLLGGLDARALLGSYNPWLIEEIATVADGGEPKLLLDVALVTARERPSSVNITLTPLESDRGQVGVLVVIEDISEEKRLQGAMRRFMTQEVVDQVLAQDDGSLFGSACTASVLFADIRGFTTMAEALSARETVETLNELFGEFYEAVSGHGGVLDKYIGDAVMAVFGAPLAGPRDPANALESGLEMLRMLEAINARRQTRGAPAMRIGIGIATGEVVAGTIGSPKRMDYTVIGDSVNLAARLQELTKTYKVEMLVDEATARAVEGLAQLRPIDLIAVRGRQRPETIYQVIAGACADPAARAAGFAAYAQGRAALAEQRGADAEAAFAEACRLDPGDFPAQLMLERAREGARGAAMG